MSPSLAIRESRQFAAEIKFVIPATLAAQVRHWARSRLQADPHAGGAMGDVYRITSLYFDTPEFDVFTQHGSTSRCKYRIRQYGDATSVFLERKLRTRRLLTKRRSLVPLPDLERLRVPTLDASWPGTWFQRRLQLRRLDPVCQISYLRTARVTLTPRGPIRLTLDEDLRALPQRQMLLQTEPGRPILPGSAVLELKYLVQMPALFKELVGEFCLAPERFSKYRHAAAALGFVPQAAAPATGTPALVKAYA